MGSTLKDVKPQRNGFVHTLLECYNRHRALTIRPDDVWLAILAEALRSLFVLHDGKKELSVEVARMDWGLVVRLLVETMNAKIQENVVDPELRQ